MAPPQHRRAGGNHGDRREEGASRPRNEEETLTSATTGPVPAGSHGRGGGREGQGPIRGSSRGAGGARRGRGGGGGRGDAGGVRKLPRGSPEGAAPTSDRRGPTGPAEGERRAEAEPVRRVFMASPPARSAGDIERDAHARESRDGAPGPQPSRGGEKAFPLVRAFASGLTGGRLEQTAGRGGRGGRGGGFAGGAAARGGEGVGRPAGDDSRGVSAPGGLKGFSARSAARENGPEVFGSQLSTVAPSSSPGSGVSDIRLGGDEFVNAFSVLSSGASVSPSRESDKRRGKERPAVFFPHPSRSPQPLSASNVPTTSTLMGEGEKREESGSRGEDQGRRPPALHPAQRQPGGAAGEGGDLWWASRPRSAAGTFFTSRLHAGPGGAAAPAANSIAEDGRRPGGGAPAEGAAAGGMSPVEELPIMRYKEAILEHIRNHPVTCIQGETGCGKSTRVPRFLLEEDMRLRQLEAERRAAGEGSGGEGGARAVPERRGLNAIVTQPRRLACIALARRVAQELEEPLGRSVGYKISGDSVTSRDTKICFVTTGYFLQVLINQPRALASLTHIILDEVHERDLDADLLSLVLKLQLNQKTPLKLIVMSATLQGNLFAEYFTPTGVPVSPRIYVGARRFPVQHVFLDDLLTAASRPDRLRGKLLEVEDLTGHGLLMEGRDDEEQEKREDGARGAAEDGKATREGARDDATPGGMHHVNLVRALLQRKKARGISYGWQAGKAIRDALGTFDRNSMAARLRKGFPSSGNLRQRGLAAAPAHAGEDKAGAEGGAGGEREVWEAEMQTSLQPQIMEGLDAVCLDLVTALGYGGETILIFLPGIGEITDLYETLSRLDSSTVWTARGGASACGASLAPPSGPASTDDFSAEGKPEMPAADALKYRIFVLHSSISRDEQEEVFSPPPSDTVHVVLASNIAESSLTLPAVRIVIDFCLKRQLVYDQRRHTAALVRAWTSHASSQQRTGRTGRVFPGLSIRLVSRQFYERCMRRFDPPEMQTAPLEKLYLTVKHLTHRLNRLALQEEGERDTDDAADQPLRGKDGAAKGKLTPCQLLRLTVQPPDVSALDSARHLLDRLGALTCDSEDAEITNLGHLMMQLPIDTHLTKLLMMGIIAGCTSDALILASVLASQDPFTMPSGLLIKHPAELSERMQLSLKSRAAYDAGHYSEPLMLRNLFVDWLTEFASSVAAVRSRLARQAAVRRNRRLEMNMKLEYLRVSRDFARGHSVVAKRMVHMAMMCADLATRLKRHLPPDSVAAASLTFFMDLLQNPTIHPPASSAVGPLAAPPCPPPPEEGADAAAAAPVAFTPRYQYSSALTYNSSAAAAAVQERFSSDLLLLKALLVAAFAPSFIVGKPRVCVDGKPVASVVPRTLKTSGDEKKGKEKSKWDLSDYAAAMLRQGLDPARTLVLHDRVDSRTGTVYKQVRASLSLVCAGLDYSIVPCEGVEDKCFLHFPDTAANACLSFDATRLPEVLQALQRRTGVTSSPSAQSLASAAAAAGTRYGPDDRDKSRADGASAPGGGLAKVASGADEEFGFRTTAGKRAHEDRMTKREAVGAHIAVYQGEDKEGGADVQDGAETYKADAPEATRAPGLTASTLALAAHLPNQFANGRWKLSIVLPESARDGTEPAPSPASFADDGLGGTEVGGIAASPTGQGSSGSLGNRFAAPGAAYGSSLEKSMAGNESAIQPFDMVRPCSPFLVCWMMMGDDDYQQPGEAAEGGAGAAPAGGKGKKKEKEQAKKKMVKMKAVTNCRNPIGFYCACPVRREEGGVQVYKQHEEVYGVVTMTQGTDDPSMCWVEGVTVLPQKHAALLMLAFLSQKHNVEMGIQVTPKGPILKEISLFNGMKTMKLPFYDDGPVVTLADLWRANKVRRLLSEVFATPKESAKVRAGGTVQASHDNCGALLHQAPTSDTVSISAVSVNIDATVRLGTRPHPSRTAIGSASGSSAPSKEDFEQINIDENAEVRRALKEMLQACNKDVGIIEASHPTHQDDWLPALTSPGYLSCLSPDLGNAMKGDLSLCRIPAFEDTPGELLSPFNLRGIAGKVERVKTKALNILQDRARAQREAARREEEKRLAAAQKRRAAQQKANQKGGRSPTQPPYPMGMAGGRQEFNPYAAASAEMPGAGGKRGGKKGRGKNAVAKAVPPAPQNAHRHQRHGAAGVPGHRGNAHLHELGAQQYRRGAAPFSAAGVPAAATPSLASQGVGTQGRMEANWHNFGAAAVTDPMAAAFGDGARHAYPPSSSYPQQQQAHPYLQPRGLLPHGAGNVAAGANVSAYGMTPAMYTHHGNYPVHDQSASNVHGGGYHSYGLPFAPSLGAATTAPLPHAYPPVGQFVAGSQYEFGGNRSVIPGYQQQGYRCQVMGSYGTSGTEEAAALQRLVPPQGGGANSLFPGAAANAGRALMQQQNPQSVRRYGGEGYL
ncbi:hypothetical protein BESB_044860 [Besnoitia besnoiti]|uniref:Helicase associated domain (Ha2) protein n=1 Tax=Besnoitia besnoiti TaxID=94643 RepID=A0A2A9MGJ8_BESBE|nr:hypothetical protein BESB_044860 [Besnoitia besnoiti]PFH36294.1 hypothetical protein BESB_044860 [Besnoitia besnoiti]